MSIENPTPLAGRGSHVQEGVFDGLMHQDEDAYLRDLAGVDSLEHARTLRVVVNTAIGSGISHLGSKLMNLVELNLSGSMLESVRDLGTGFRSLQVLWVARCGLQGLDGLAALPSLRELYASYNDITDLQPLDSCAELEVLDVEGNCIADVEGLHVLASCCPKLQSLSLSGNPVASDPEYRSLASSLISSLCYLDDERVTSAHTHGEPYEGHLALDTASASTTSHQSPSGSTILLSSCVAPSDDVKSTSAESELLLVLSGIKHARVGVDSAEFRELEMTLLVASELPSEDAPPPGTGMMPVSASSWMRCSQQCSLPSLSRSLAATSATASSSPRASSGGSAGSSSRLAPPHDRSSSGQQQQQPIKRVSSGSGRPPSARPFSARIGTASLVMRPGSAALGAAAGSAPPTAGGGGLTGGLYWKKNRLMGSLAAGGSGKASSAMDDDEEAGGSTLTFGGTDGTIGGSLAKDLRRRKRATPPSGAVRGGDSGGSVLDIAEQTASGKVGGGAPLGKGSATWNRTAASGSERSSYDSAALLEELRRWKVGERFILPNGSYHWILPNGSYAPLSL